MRCGWWTWLTSLVLGLCVRPLAEPLCDLGPDVLASLRAGHQADVAAGAVEVGDVGARDLVEHRQGALTRGDVVRSGRDHEQVLLDGRHAGATLAQAHAPADQAVLLVHPGDPLAIGTAGKRRVVGHPLGHGLVGVAAYLAVEHLLPEAAVGGP